MIKQLYGDARVGRSIICGAVSPLHMIFSRIYITNMKEEKHFNYNFEQLTLNQISDIIYEHLK